MSETKYIPYSELKVGMEITGYKKGNTTSYCNCKIISIEGVKVSFNWGESLKDASDYMFSVELTYEELIQKYCNDIKEIKEALTHNLGQVDGYHEMWNSWLYAGSLAKLASNLSENKLRIVGFATLMTPRHSMLSDEVLDIGIVAEYENGDRIWCHTSDNYRKRLIGMEC